MTAQTLDRGIHLLRLLASAGPEGCRLVELQRESGLTKPTVHRILNTLRQHAFVEQVQDSKRYRLGPEIAVLSWFAARQVNSLKELCDEDMVAVAALTGDTSFLSVRTGHETICIDRKTGSYPVKAFTVDVGTRRPLGLGATGVALLASLESEELRAAMSAIAPTLTSFPNVSLRHVREAVANAQRSGYALSDGMVLKGVRGIAVTIFDPRGQPAAAIGIAAISERITAKRMPELVRTLKIHAGRIEQKLAAAGPDVSARRNRR